MKDLNIIARVPLKDLKIKEPKVGIRTPQVLCTSNYQGFLRGDILDANSVYSLVEDLHVPDVEEINKKLKGVAYQDRANTFTEDAIFSKKLTVNSDTELNGPLYVNAPNGAIIFSADTARIENVYGIKGAGNKIGDNYLYNNNGSVTDITNVWGAVNYLAAGNDGNKSVLRYNTINGHLNYVQFNEASSQINGLMSAADKIKLDSIDTSKLVTTDDTGKIPSKYIPDASIDDSNYAKLNDYNVFTRTQTLKGAYIHGMDSDNNDLSSLSLKKDGIEITGHEAHIGGIDISYKAGIGWGITAVNSVKDSSPTDLYATDGSYFDASNVVKLTNGKIDSTYLADTIVDSSKLNNTVQRLFVNGGDGQYLRTENIADANKYYATDGSIQSITDKIANYIKANPVSSTVPAATTTAIGGVK